MQQHDSTLVNLRNILTSKPVPAGNFYDIAANWKRVLIDAGAVKWPRQGSQLGAWVQLHLQKDIARYHENPIKFHSIEAAKEWREQSPAWKCLCDGDRPSISALRFGGLGSRW